MGKRFAEILAEVESKQGFLFTNKRYLDPLYCTGDLVVGRDEKTRELLELLIDYKRGYVPPLIPVYGKSGTGKSTIVRNLCKKLGIESCYVNLRQARTVFSCVNLILEELGLKGVKNASGLGMAIREIEKQVESMTKNNGKLFALILDEIDMVFRDKRGDPSDFIYKLLTLQERLREKNCMMTIIAISNGVISDYDLNDRVRSRLGTVEVFFGAYTKEELTSILRKRARKAFGFDIDNGALEYCAEVASLDHGDARRAIDLLRQAAEIAGKSGETRKISKANIDEALDVIETDGVTKMLRSSPYRLRLVAAALAKATYLDQGGRDKWYTTATVVDEYRKILEDMAIEILDSKIKPEQIEGKLEQLLEKYGGPIEPVSYRRVSSLLRELYDIGIADMYTSSGGRHGRNSKFQLTAPAEIVGRASLPEWWDKAVAEKRNFVEQVNAAELRGRMMKVLRPKIGGRLRTVDGDFGTNPAAEAQ